MNKVFRILVVLAFLLVILALGMKNTVWADKLGAVNQSPAANGFDQNLPAGSRPQGTVITGNPNVPLTPGQNATVGSCSTVLLKNGSADFKYTASATNKNEFNKSYPGNLTSCLIKVMVVPANNKTQGADLQVCFPLAPAQTGVVYYWDGTQWVKTTLAVKGNQACIDVPSSAPNPLYTAMFDK
jgi:hypothetical protein